MKKYKVGILGASGAVGREMIKVLAERNFPVEELKLFASERSVGKKVEFCGKEIAIELAALGAFKGLDFVLGAASNAVAKQFAEDIVNSGATFIDNSSAFRMDPDIPLVVPEINADDARNNKKGIIANPNCSTIQMLVAIADLHKRFQIKRIVVSTYQCITGTGKKAVDQMSAEREGKESPVQAYPYRIDLNLLPHIDVFLENGYTKEEMKMVNETRKIMRDESIRVSPTAIRVPVLGGHAESINLEFAKSFEMEEIFETLRGTAGVVVQDAVAVENGEQPQAIGSVENLPYPMPLFTKDRDEVFVGRIRRDPSLENGINLWCVADNLRKGAATNAVQIAELLIKKGLV